MTLHVRRGRDGRAHRVRRVQHDETHLRHEARGMPDLVLTAHLPPGHIPAAGEVVQLDADGALACIFAKEA